MEKQKYSGEVNLDHPVIDEQEDGIDIYFHDLPPMLLHNPITISPEDQDPPPPDEDPQ